VSFAPTAWHGLGIHPGRRGRGRRSSELRRKALLRQRRQRRLSGVELGLVHGCRLHRCRRSRPVGSTGYCCDSDNRRPANNLLHDGKLMRELRLQCSGGPTQKSRRSSQLQPMHRIGWMGRAGMWRERHPDGCTPSRPMSTATRTQACGDYTGRDGARGHRRPADRHEIADKYRVDGVLGRRMGRGVRGDAPLDQSQEWRWLYHSTRAKT
jgi:hypothetical protein